MTSTERRLVDWLARLAHEYRHFQQEHEREAADSPTRSTLATKMSRARDRFERLLAHWVEDAELRDAWLLHLHGERAQPDQPLIATPPAFRGRTEIDSELEIRPTEDGGYDLIVDGAIESHETVPWNLSPDLIEPIQIRGRTCRETFSAPEEAVRALADFLATPNAEPPWRWAPALFEDGLVDENFALTPRGFRRLGKAAPARPARPRSEIVYGVLAVDAAHARVFVLECTDGEHAPTTAPMLEVAQTTNPDQRARDAELFANTRPGLRREGPHGPRHAVSDRRQSRRHEMDQRFAGHVVDDAARAWRSRGVTRVVLVAGPGMLGVLRPLMTRPPIASGASSWPVVELARDLARLSAPALHDALGEAGLVPLRGRLPPLIPQPGLPA